MNATNREPYHIEVEFDIEKPRFRPRTIFTVRHLIHGAHLLVPVVAIVILTRAYVNDVRVVILNDGTRVMGFPPPHFSLDQWETFVGVGLLLLSLAAAIAERLVRWKNQSVLIPPWGETAEDSSNSDVAYVWARGIHDITAVLRFLEIAFPPRWFLARSISDRQQTLDRLFQKCPRSILMICERTGQRWKLIGCSLIAPLSQEAFFAYRNGTVDNWLIESEDFKDRSRFLLSNYLFCYGRRLGPDLRETFVRHVTTLCAERDPGVVIIAPRKSGNGQENMRRLGAYQVGHSFQKFPLFELDLRREDELGASASATRQAMRNAIRSAEGADTRG